MTYEVDQVCMITWMLLTIQLSLIPSIHKQLDTAPKSLSTA